MPCKFLLFIVLIAGLPFADGNAQQNGEVLETSPHKFPSWTELPPWMKTTFPEEAYKNEFLNPEAMKLERIKYYSDGLKIVGFIYTPKLAGSKRLPVIIYNRPGVGEAAKIGNENFRDLYEMYQCAAKGFIVVASQYRGVDGSEGKDEVGGADVNDIMNLLPLVKKLNNADTENIFIWGSSRGGSMTLQAVRNGFPARAIAVVGAVTDWRAQFSHNDRLGKEFWPDYENKKEEHFNTRSAINWVKDLPNIPILIMHGGNDISVDPEQAIQFASKLHQEAKVFSLMLVANDDHLLTQNLDKKIECVIDWFSKPRLVSTTTKP